MTPTSRWTTAVLTTAVLALAACSTPGTTPTPSAGPWESSAGPTPSGTPSASPRPSPSPTPSASSTPGAAAEGRTDADDPLAGMSLEEKVGQLLVVGAPVAEGGVHAPTRTAVVDHHVGNVFLHGRSEAGLAATRELVDAYRALAPSSAPPMLVATDQEGGAVQVLRGAGFSEIPAATRQATWPRARLERLATRWGTELADAGVDLNLAPVMDLVPAGNQQANAPIGYFSRNYGNTARSVVDGATAFSAGMQSAGVEPVIKHFPGLGRVTENTDTTASVVDDTITAGSKDVEVFAAGIDAGARFVMLSNAVYTRIDPDQQATFSPAVVAILRDDLAFDGVVITDDVSAAAAVDDVAPADRAVAAVEAGVDLVLASADPSVVPAMADALVERARADEEFAAQVDTAVERVLAAKADLPD
ncbi:glycoside hydrolase family 3 N-terminal domain-containing protein [Isoptericola sp. b408]|uniref:glycoside hydrolase family 3 N-terminal domain-containing protein n=1 Tax=Isoptericola sp. b408 TaxID=3064653 RepID=UPI00271225D6|nr:glycoside hydrolase family 3 N-terminal domain-containing protein [Isoptericola sp. b408]MDO8150159.1 glycoside hydrolase family 3 N-terminal domain-containing protein [Isoptericola sp. b408]